MWQQLIAAMRNSHVADGRHFLSMVFFMVLSFSEKINH